MLKAEFASSRAGQVILTPQGYEAFVPAPLPPRLNLDWDLGRAIADAERALGNLSGVGSTLPNPHLLINPFMRKEAVLSSRIEGTQASLSDLFLFEAAGAPERDTSDVREVANYVRALREGLRRVKEMPISLRFLRDMHATLMRGVRGDDLTPGEFRTTQNWIGFPGARLNEAIFVPPPVTQMNESLDAFERSLHEPQTLPFLVWLALVHYQFEAIHPFRDGNGRIGRLLLVLLMCVHEALCQPLLYLSAYFEKHRTEYYDGLLAVSQRGEWEQWIRFFLCAIEEQSKDAIRTATTLNALRDEYRTRLQAARASALLLRTVDEMFQFPAISMPSLAKELKVTYRSAQLIIDRLIAANILKEATGKARNRIYLAPQILSIIDPPTDA
jgi:cell filamentation protein, protein adenylyltransferase